MTKNEFKEIFSLLLDEFDVLEDHFENLGEGCFQFWYEKFNFTSKKCFKIAVKNYAQKEERVPTIAGIRKYMPPDELERQDKINKKGFSILEGG